MDRTKDFPFSEHVKTGDTCSCRQGTAGIVLSHEASPVFRRGPKVWRTFQGKEGSCFLLVLSIEREMQAEAVRTLGEKGRARPEKSARKYES